MCGFDLSSQFASPVAKAFQTVSCHLLVSYVQNFKKWSRIENTRLSVLHIIRLNIISGNVGFGRVCVYVCVLGRLVKYASCYKLHTKIFEKYCFEETSFEHFLPYNAILLWLALPICEARRTASFSNFSGFEITCGICIRNSLTLSQSKSKSHGNTYVTTIILFISVFWRKRLWSRNTLIAHTTQQAGGPEKLISGHWMWCSADGQGWFVECAQLCFQV